jgi:hypothetical protein
MRIEGYWKRKDTNCYDEYSWPEPHDEPQELEKEFLAALAEAEKIAEQVNYRGFSICRLCDKDNGSSEFVLHGWKWPSGFKHYVEVHHIRPSEEFLLFILGL